MRSSSSSSPSAALVALLLLVAAATSSSSSSAGDEADLAPSGIHVVRAVPHCRRVEARDLVEAAFLRAAGSGFVPSTKEGTKPNEKTETWLLNF